MNRKVASSEPFNFHARTPKCSVCHVLFIYGFSGLYQCFILLCLVCFSPLIWQSSWKGNLTEVQSHCSSWLGRSSLSWQGRQASRVASKLGWQREWLVVPSLSSLNAKGEMWWNWVRTTKSSARSPIWKVPQPSKTTLPAGDQLFKHMSLWGAFHIQTTTKTIDLWIKSRGQICPNILFWGREDALNKI